MKINKLIVTIFALAYLLLSGCATTTQSIIYPPFTNEIRVHVSKDIVSTWTETPANDAVIPESQVFVAKKSSASSMLGGALGVAVRRSKAKSETSGALNELSLYFDKIVADKLSAIRGTPSITVKESDENVNFLLLPSVRFEVNKQKLSSLYVRLTSRYLTDTEKPQTKNYYYLVSDEYNVEGDQGWFGVDNPFEETTELAFEMLTRAFYSDITGKLINSGTAQKQAKAKLFSWSKKAQDVVIHKTYDKYSAVSFISRGVPFTKDVFLIQSSKLM